MYPHQRGLHPAITFLIFVVGIGALMATTGSTLLVIVWTCASGALAIAGLRNALGDFTETGPFDLGGSLLFDDDPRAPVSTRCPKCGYDLRGCVIAGCPECGWMRIDHAPVRGRAANHVGEPWKPA